MKTMTDGVYVAAEFFPDVGRIIHCAPHLHGHIQDTFIVTGEQDGLSRRFVFQRINQHVFNDIDELMSNIARVCAHLAAKTNDSREALKVYYTTDNKPYALLPNGGCWRVYGFIENAHTRERAATPAEAREVAFAAGRFVLLLEDLPGPLLSETISGFHDTCARLDQLRSAMKNNKAGRAAMSKDEFNFIMKRAELAAGFAHDIKSGKFPLRIVHNDTKMNNVMLDNDTGAALCMIDLDTVMPGYVVHDFGDMVRCAVSPSAEEDADPAHIQVRLDFFEALVRGYTDAVGSILTKDEWLWLPLAGQLMNLELSSRFLTDYLEGDVYFKTSYAEHNLERCRAQLCLLQKMEKRTDEMTECVQKILRTALTQK